MCCAFATARQIFDTVFRYLEPNVATGNEDYTTIRAFDDPKSSIPSQTRSRSSQLNERRPRTGPTDSVTCQNEPQGSAFRRHTRAINFGSDKSNHRNWSEFPSGTNQMRRLRSLFSLGKRNTDRANSVMVRTSEHPRLYVLSLWVWNHTQR